MDDAAFSTDPLSDIQSQRLMLDTAVRTEFGRREEAINAQDFATGPCGFVLNKVHKLIPTSISDGLGKVVILQHPRGVERFKGNHSEGIDNSSAQFVMKVFALVSDLLVDGGNGKAGFASTIATACPSKKFL